MGQTGVDALNGESYKALDKSPKKQYIGTEHSGLYSRSEKSNKAELRVNESS